MAPLTKDSVEVASPAASTPGQTGKPTSALRADAVSLEVQVKVHGSRVINAGRGGAPQTEPFEEQTVTMIVFPQGAVLRMSTAVNVSQMLVLTNIKTKQDSICRVLKVRPNANQGSYVEVEFTHRQPGYWGIQFPGEGPVTASTTAPSRSNFQPRPATPVPPTAPVVSAPVTPSSAVPQREVKAPVVAPPPAPAFVPAAKPESPFISIGSKEEVQEAASATAITKPLSPVERRLESQAASASKYSTLVDPLTATPPAPVPSIAMDELLGDAETESAQSVADEGSDSMAASASIGLATDTGSTLASASSAPPEAFGARLDSSFGSATAKSEGPSQNWMLIAACVAVVVAALGGGVAYFRQKPENPAAKAAAISHDGADARSTSNDAAQLPAITPPSQPYMAGGTEANAASRNNVEYTSAGSAPSPSPARDTRAAIPNGAAAHVAASTPAPTKQSGLTSAMVSTALSERPKTSARGDEGQAEQAPAVDAGAAPSSVGSLPGIAANSAPIPAPTVQPEAPVKIGGNVRAPKMISSVPPVYPASARSSGVQGDVVVETTIDKNGNVVKMHVVSGASMLRNSAVESLRRWKFEPSKLDGEPVEVQMQVTIKFRL